MAQFMDQQVVEQQAMFEGMMDRRKLVVAGMLALLAACTAGPKGPVTPPPPQTPNANVLPTDTARHRVALLVPLTGPNAAAGQSISNAATMALLDTNADNLRITTYDTAPGAAAAAAKAVADGNKLILGPLLSDDIPAVAASAQAARLPVIAFSNDDARASRTVFIMGNPVNQSIARVVAFSRTRGAVRFGALIPEGEYGQRASTALFAAVRASGGTVAVVETFGRTGPALTAAIGRLRLISGYDTVLVAEGGRMAAQAGPLLKPNAASALPRIIGTDLWSGERIVMTTPALQGALYAAPSDGRYGHFSESYRTRFGTQPYRIAVLGYDAVLLALRVAREWRPGTNFPTARLTDRGGFVGVDGVFRFNASGVIERALEVREVRAGGVNVVSPAPSAFQD